MIREMHRWWLAHSRGNVPDRAGLQPSDFKGLLPYLLISDVEHEPFRIRYRLVGTKVVEATGLDITGRYLDELVLSDPDEPSMNEYAAAYMDRRPVAGKSTITLAEDVRFIYEFGLFPLRLGGTTIDQFVAVEDYFGFSHLFPDLPPWRPKSAAPA